MMRIESISGISKTVIHVNNDELIYEHNFLNNKYKAKFYLSDLSEHFTYSKKYTRNPSKSFKYAFLFLAIYSSAFMSSFDDIIIELIKIISLAFMATYFLLGIVNYFFTRENYFVFNSNGKYIFSLDLHLFDEDELHEFMKKLELAVKNSRKNENREKGQK